MGKKIISKNKEGLFNYEILETFEAGIVLTGAEVRSVKGSQISLKGSYASLDHNNEAWLANTYIAPYKPAAGHQTNYQPDRRRKLLLHKKEISALIGKSKQKGLTIIPISVYTINGLIKVDLALARGRTKIDKREAIKKREVQKRIRQAIKEPRRRGDF